MTTLEIEVKINPNELEVTDLLKRCDAWLYDLFKDGLIESYRLILKGADVTMAERGA